MSALPRFALIAPSTVFILGKKAHLACLIGVINLVVVNATHLLDDA